MSPLYKELMSKFLKKYIWSKPSMVKLIRYIMMYNCIPLCVDSEFFFPNWPAISGFIMFMYSMLITCIWFKMYFLHNEEIGIHIKMAMNIPKNWQSTVWSRNIMNIYLQVHNYVTYFIVTVILHLFYLVLNCTSAFWKPCSVTIYTVI